VCEAVRRVESAGSICASEDVRPPEARVVDIWEGEVGRIDGRGLGW
jgi:hypothetical protein